MINANIRTQIQFFHQEFVKEFFLVKLIFKASLEKVNERL